MAAKQIANYRAFSSLSHTFHQPPRTAPKKLLHHRYFYYCYQPLGNPTLQQNPASINSGRRLHSSSKRAPLTAPTTTVSTATATATAATAKKALMSASIFSFFGSLFSSSARAENSNMTYPDQRTDDEWRAVLSPEQFRVIRNKGTEPAFTGAYDKHYPSSGVYNCAACDAPLYKADTKFKSGCGWPAYFDSLPGAVTRHVDNSLGMERIEIVCSNCGGHLGHVFKGEGYPTPTDERHCVNSVSLKFSNGGGEGGEQKETAKA